ncbi:hypothetical protein [Devosia sp.]|uniref:hypothetical protein n=1 Tax=Devosia sp. TaxID=1871048 RepID=UPI003264D811
MRIWMGLIGLILLAMPAMAEDFDNPKVLLRDIYTRLEKGEDPPYANYFSDSLMALMNANDARIAAGEEDALDFDPLSNSQDPAGLKATVGEPVVEGVHATGDVTLTALQHQVLHYDLIKQANGWKVDDIHIDDDSEGAGWRLSELLATDPLMN